MARRRWLGCPPALTLAVCGRIGHRGEGHGGLMHRTGDVGKVRPPERGAGASLGAVLLGPYKVPLGAPAIQAAQPAATAILHGLARRTAPQTQPPATRSRASRWAAQESPAGKQVTPAGPKWGMMIWGLARPGPTASFNPSEQSRKRILHKKGPSAKPGPGSQDNDQGVHISHAARADSHNSG